MAAKQKPAESHGYGLLIAAVVAIVALVGLVILFKGETTGRLVEMQSNWNYEPGLADTMERSYKMGFAPDLCGPGSVINHDFNTGREYCAPATGAVLNENYYAGYNRAYNKGYRESQGGMAIEERTSGGDSYISASSDNTFNRGAYHKVVTEGLEKSTLPSASKEGITIG